MTDFPIQINQGSINFISFIIVKLLSRVIGFLKFPMLPEDGLSKTEICCSLQHIYMIFSFLIILKL